MVAAVETGAVETGAARPAPKPEVTASRSVRLVLRNALCASLFAPVAAMALDVKASDCTKATVSGRELLHEMVSISHSKEAISIPFIANSLKLDIQKESNVVGGIESGRIVYMLDNILGTQANLRIDIVYDTSDERKKVDRRALWVTVAITHLSECLDVSDFELKDVLRLTNQNVIEVDMSDAAGVFYSVKKESSDTGRYPINWEWSLKDYGQQKIDAPSVVDELRLTQVVSKGVE